MKELPPGLSAYKKTPVFTAETVPKGLQNDHQTKDGTWAVIHVLKGELQYDIPSRGETHVLTSETPGIVEPTVLHKVTPLGPVEFYVEFHR